MYRAVRLGVLVVGVVFLSSRVVAEVLSCGGGALEPGWSHSWGGEFDDVANGVVVDGSGNTFITGGTSSFSSSSDVLLLKYDPAGTVLFSKTWGGDQEDKGESLCLDSAGAIYVAGTTTSFGGGQEDILLLKYDSSGVIQWARTWGLTSYDGASGVVCDAQRGSIYVVGLTRSFTTIGPNPDAILLKYDTSGRLQWTRRWGTESDDEFYAAALDSSGNIYATGSTYAPDNVLTVKIDPTGNLVWSREWGGGGDDNGDRIAVDRVTGAVYVAAYSNSSGRGLDSVLLKYDSNGSFTWGRFWGQDGAEQPRGVAVDSVGNIWVSGTTSAVSSGGRTDAYLLEYTAGGDLIVSESWQAASNVGGQGASLNASSCSVHILGVGSNSSGGWYPIANGACGEPSGGGVTPSPSVGSLDCDNVTASGEETPVSGVVDVGGGASDVLLLRLVAGSTDQDGDGVPDACDSAPTDDQTWAAPYEVEHLRWRSDNVTIEWDSLAQKSGPSTSYDLMYGDLEELPFLGSGAGESCMENDLAATTVIDSSPQPLPEKGWFFLVRGQNSCGTGTYGASFSGEQRQSAACP